MIEADIKKFLNDRVPNDPEFKALNRQIEGLEGLLAAEADKEKLRRMRRRFANAAAYCAGVNFPNTAALYFPTARSQYNNSNIFLSSHYANNIGWGNTNTFKLKINDTMDTFVYLYTDGASASYTMWRLAGSYNGSTFLTQSTRTAISFTGLPSDISYTAMDMSADGDIVCVTTGNEANRLTVLKRSSGSNTAYTAVTVDAQPSANASALCISGDGRVILVSHTAAPYLTVYMANADRSAYTRQSLAELGVSVSRAVYIAAASFDGATFALGYNQNTAVNPAADVYRQQPGGVYAKAGVDYLSLYSLSTLCYEHREGLQLSRDGNTLLMFLRYSSLTRQNTTTKSGAFPITQRNTAADYLPVTLIMNCRRTATGFFPASFIAVPHRPTVSTTCCGLWMCQAGLSARLCRYIPHCFPPPTPATKPAMGPLTGRSTISGWTRRCALSGGE